MLIYEKENKLNINFDNEVSEQPNVQIGKDEISLDGATISKDSVLPTPNVEEDVGKVPTVQEDGSYALANAGGSGGGAFIVTITSSGIPPVYAVDKTAAEVYAAVESGKPVYGYYDPGSGTVNFYGLAEISFDGQTPIGYTLSSMLFNSIMTINIYEEDGVTTVTYSQVDIPNNP